jgi:hypothetical protein
MVMQIHNQLPIDSPAVRYCQALCDRASRIRMPELFTNPPPNTLYHLPDRHGVSVVVLGTASLRPDQLTKILTYRLAQYIAIGFVDPGLVYDRQMEHEPLANVSADDVHFIAGSSDTGELLCYMVMKGVAAPPEATFRTHERPLFPVEQVFGWGVYHRLQIVPDLPVSRIRELGRFVKNQQASPANESGARAPAEIVVAILRLLSGPLAGEVIACIGDMEERVVKKNLDFFHIPTVVVHGVVPYTSEDVLVGLGYAIGTRYPFAFLSSDISLARLAAVEAALAQPGQQGIHALLMLRRDKQVAPSSLMPPGGLPTLTDMTVPQEGQAMHVRRQFLDRGAWLRTIDIFSSLSPAEAAVLGTLLEPRGVAAADVIVRQGGAAMVSISSKRARSRRGAAVTHNHP